jgi:LacI family transcriptional regulator, galactose operon repressor
MKATIRSVAKMAGVSASTVSHYLNQTAPISSGTAQSVERAIASLNYRVNLGARALRLRKTHSIGLVIPNLSTPFFAEIAAMIEDALWKKGYQTLLCISERDVEREFAQFTNLRSRQVDGVLISYGNEKSKVIKTARESPVPVIFIDRPVPGEFSLASENYYGGQLAARHLAELGHVNIGMLCGEAEIRNVTERINGFFAELKRWKITVRPDYMLHGLQELQFGLRVAELVEKDPRPTAIFATNDIVAIGAWSKLLELGYSIPKDISLVGFDDIEMSRYLAPPLTTVAQRSREIVSKAVELLLDLIADKERFSEGAPTSVMVTPALQVRGSTGAPPE